jgi:hypothetical protein
VRPLRFILEGAAFHAGLFGTVLWAPLVYLVAANRHSLQLEWTAHLQAVLVFLVLPVGVMIAAEAGAQTIGPAARQRFCGAATAAAGYLFLVQLAMAGSLTFPNRDLASLASVLLPVIPCLLLARRGARVRVLLGAVLGLGLLALVHRLPALWPALSYERSLWLVLIALALWAAIARARAIWLPLQRAVRTLGVLSVLVAVGFVLAPLVSGSQGEVVPVRHGPGDASEGGAGPVFLLVFDGLSREALLGPDGQIAPRFPRIRELARAGPWIERATTNFDLTTRAIPSMLLGAKSGRIGLDMRPGLFEHLAGHVRAEIYGSALNYCDHYPRAAVYRCVDSRRYLSGPGSRDLPELLLDLLLQGTLPWLFPLTPGELGVMQIKRGSVAMVEELFEALERETLHDRLYFVHVLSPHFPFVMEGDGRAHERAPMYFHKTGSEAELRQAYEHYLREIDYLDVIVGRLIDLLVARGVWKTSTIVVTADHGATWTWGAREWGSRLRDYVDDRIARVPFLIKPSEKLDFSGRTGDYQHIDFVPTVLDLMGIEPLPGALLEGRSVLRAGTEHRPLEIVSMAGSTWRYDEDARQWRRQAH